MAPVKKTSGRKKTPARSSSSTKTSRRTAAQKKAAGKATAKRTTAKKSATRTGKSTAKKTAAKKTSTKKSAKKTSPKKTKARKTPAKKTARRTAKTSAKKTAAKKTAAKKTAAKKTATKPTRKTAAGAPAVRGPTAVTPRARPRARAVKFDKKQLAEIRQQLERERGNLLAQLDELTADSFDGTQSDMTGEVGLDDDFADAGSATFERERDLSIQNNVRDLIDQMNRAIQRIEDGNYGTCERCGNPIEAARLKALPHALLCMDCKRREERAR
jgi:RNA polymerase-binding protein DksA